MTTNYFFQIQIQINKMSDKIKFKIKNDMFPDFISKLKDLTNIDKTIKLKIDRDNILMYSMLGSGSIMVAFKNYILKTSDYLETKEDIEYTYDIIITSCDKFVKNLSFIKEEDLIGMVITHRDSNENDDVRVARKIEIKGGKLKVNWLAGEYYEVRDLTKEKLEENLDLDNRTWNFSLTQSQFSDVKKLSKINTDNIITFNVDKGKVSIFERAAWDLEIGMIENIDKNFIFNKRFLKCVDETMENIEFSLFDTFILVKNNDNNLMLSYEQDFSDEDL